jgi:hypothetical protein
MFLVPAIIAAAVIEYGSAIKATENQNLRGNITPQPPPKPQDDGPRVARPPRHSEDVDEQDMTDKQLVVFGTDPKTPGIISYTGDKQVQEYLPYSQIAQYSKQDIAKSPIVRQACEYAVLAAFPAYTPSFISNTAIELCFKAIHTITVNGLELLETNVVEAVKNLWSKMKGSAKAQLPWKMAKKAARASTSSVREVMNRQVPVRNSNSLNSQYVSAPAAQSMVTGRLGQPRIRNGRRGVTITHSEMLNTLTASSTANGYKAINYTINPAKADVFPWLSNIATSYDKYMMRKLKITLNTIQPTTVAGKFGIGYDPDSTDDLPVDRTEVYAMYKHMESPVWQSICLDIPVSGKELYCNTHSVSDSKLVDDGMIVLFADLVATASMQLADVIVEYEVDLLDPQQALFSTQLETFLGVTYTNRKVLPPYTVHGPSLSTTVISTANSMFLVPSPGYYYLSVMAYDAGASTPVITFTNNTTADMYGFKIGNTTNCITIVYFKIYSNSLNMGSAVITGESMGLTLTGAANWLALENFTVTLSRIAPPIYTTFLTTGWTTVAPTATL